MKRRHVLIMVFLAALLASCQHFNAAQVTYDFLRADDCRRNELEDFCGRTYAIDYHNYVRIRREFLRDERRRKATLQPNALILPEDFIKR